MMDLLETLASNGLSDSELDAVLKDLIENDDFEDDADQRCCVALAWYKSEGGSADPSDCMNLLGDDTVHIGGCDYRVLTDEEADEACKAGIKESIWTFTPKFLSWTTGIDASVFESLAEKCENAQDAIESIIKGSCGLDHFTDEAISADGRGQFLGTYDGDEIEFRGTDWFLYRVQ